MFYLGLEHLNFANCFLSVYEQSIFKYFSGFDIILNYLYVEQCGAVFTVSSNV